MKSTLDTEEPWIPYSCCMFLDTIVKPGLRVFEYGSGGSTLYFARKFCRVTSIEHDQAWFDRVHAELQLKKYNWVNLKFIPPGEKNIGQDRSRPEHYYEPPYPGNYLDYVLAIDDYPDRSFDIIMVDGTARPSCLLHAHPKLKHGGYLILDNSEREFYLQIVGHLFESWERATFWGHGPLNSYMWECSIWRKQRIQR